MSLNECMNRMHVPQCCLNFATMAALCSDNILRNYDPSAELVLQCDASSVRVGAVLLQPGNDGSLQPVAYASRTLIHVERNYAPIERESFSELLNFVNILLGRHFKLLTDHKLLITLLGEHKLVPQLASARVVVYKVPFDPLFCGGSWRICGGSWRI